MQTLIVTSLIREHWIPIFLSNIFPSSSVSFPIKKSVQANTTPASVDTFDSTLSKISDNYLQFMAAARIRELISTRHNTMTAYSHSGVSRTLQFTTPPPSTTVVALIKTLKMNIIFFFLLSAVLTLGLLTFSMTSKVLTISLDITLLC